MGDGGSRKEKTKCLEESEEDFGISEIYSLAIAS